MHLTPVKEHSQGMNTAYFAAPAIASAIIAKKQFPALHLIVCTLDFGLIAPTPHPPPDAET